jgi:hypothetical protein
LGLDPDPRAFARARRKAERKALSIQVDHGFSDMLPYPDGSFDRVLSALHRLTVHFDEGIFPSEGEAERLQRLFRALKNVDLRPREDSKLILEIQVADVVAHSFGQIVKAEISGEQKVVDIGGSDTGYAEGTTAPLGWSLLMSLRYALLTRPVAYEGNEYPFASDPVVLDPLKDDPAEYDQHPILLGWGIQVAPESSTELRSAVERSLGRLWLGCIH